MVKAILSGQKTQTRRVITPRNCKAGVPIYQPGDVLWVRESWQLNEMWEDCEYGTWEREPWTGPIPKTNPGERYEVAYLASSNIDGPWKPSIHMPRWMSRIQLKINSVRVERVQDISAADCVAEGASNPIGTSRHYGHVTEQFAIECFVHLWDSINASRGFGWNVNPSVIVLDFERIEGDA